MKAKPEDVNMSPAGFRILTDSICPKTSRALVWRVRETMSGENRCLVTNEPVEFEKRPVEVRGFRRTTDHFRGIYGIYLGWIKQHRKMSTCNRLDLDSPDLDRLYMPKNFPGTGLESKRDYVRGEPVFSYKWTGQVSKTTRWSLWWSRYWVHNTIYGIWCHVRYLRRA